MASNIDTLSRPQLVSSFKSFSKWTSIFVFSVGCLVLGGWVFDLPYLKSVLPGLATMKANTALGFVLSGISLWILWNEKVKGTRHRMSQICAMLVALLGFLTLGEYLSGRDFGIDQLLFQYTDSSTLYPGRMSQATAFNFFLIGLALLFLDNRWRGYWLSDFLAVTALLISTLALIGYIYGVSSLYQIGAYSSMAFHTALNFALISMGILFARPQRSLMAIVASKNLGGVLARRLLPAAIIIPFVLGWLRLAGQVLGLYDTRFGLTIFALSNVIIFTILILWNARILNQVDISRKQAEDSLRKIHDDLEFKFQQRTVALSQTNALLETMLDYVPDQIYFKDTESRFIKNSKSQAKALGLDDPALVVGKTDFDFFSHAQRSYDEEQKIIQSGKPLVDFEERVIWPDGQGMWVSTTKMPLRNQEGKIIGTFGISRNITERKRAEESLQKAKDELDVRVAERTVELIEANQQLQLELGERKQAEEKLRGSEERYRTLVEQASDGIFIADPDGNYTDVNSSGCAMLGYTREELLRLTLRDIVEPEDLAAHPLRLKELQEEKTLLVERKLRRKNGSTFFAELSAKVLPHGYYQAIVRDITERKQMEETLRENEVRYSRFFENMHETFVIQEVVKDDAGNPLDLRFIDINPATERIMGKTRSEVIGRTRSQITGQPDPEGVEMVSRVASTGTPYHMVRHSPGFGHWFESFSYSLGSGMVATLALDITERKQAEEALRESESNARSLLRLSKRLEQAQAYSEALSAALDEVKIVLGYQNVWTYLLSEDKEQLKLLTMTGEKSQAITDDFITLKIKGDRFLEEISEGTDIVLVEDARIDPRTNKDIVEQLGNRTIVNVPIIFMDKQLGIFGTGTFGDEGVHIPTSAQLDYLRALASHLAVTLDRIHLLNQRKLVEAELYKSEELLRLGYDTAKLGIWQNDIITGMIHFDERARIQYGFDLEDVPITDVITRVHPDDVTRLADEIASTTDPASDGRYGTEYRVVHSDGSVHWLAVHARVYFAGEGDSRHPVTGFGTSQDITERKQAEALIQRNATRDQMLAEVSGALADVHQDYQSVLDTIAQRMVELIGDLCNIHLLSEDGEWFELAAVYHPDPEALAFFHEMLGATRTRVDEGLSGRVIQTGQALLLPVTSPEQIKTTINAKYWPLLERFPIHSILVTPLRAQGRVLGVLSMIRITPGHSYTVEDQAFLQDLADRAALAIVNTRLYTATQQMNMELEEHVTERTAQLEAVNKELEAFSYSVSHDLRSPLRGIDGWSLALSEDYSNLLDEQGQAHIQRVRTETQRMGILIDDILQLSRITRAEMNKEKVDLSAIAETVTARLQETKSEDRQVEFVIQKGLTAMGDPKLLDVVLTNLLGNAFKFTSKKQEARIEFGKTIVEGENAFYVYDNGAGFDMAYASKLFGAFQRMHRVSEFPGTGVGLATVQRVINRHGGSIWASSEVGQGATFYFTLEDQQ